MGCGCGRRARARARGQAIAGYRVTLPDGTVVPTPPNAPFFSPQEASAEVRRNNGGTVLTEYTQIRRSA